MCNFSMTTCKINLILLQELSRIIDVWKILRKNGNMKE